MSPLNRGPLLGPRMPPAGMRPPPPRFGRLPMPGMPPRMPPPPIPPMVGMFGPMRQRMPPPPPRPAGMMRPGGPPPPPPPPPLFGPRNRGPPPLMMGPMMGPRGMGPRGPPIRPGPRGIMPPQVMPHMRPRFPPGNGTVKGKNHINNAKKVNKLEELELKKPWMTDEIRSEIQKKNKLYAKAKKNKDAKEWEEFKDLRNKVTRMIRDAKNEYLAKHPDQASVYQGEPDYCDKRDENDDDEEEDEKTYYCEICDREFFNENLLNDHKNSHRTCGIDGCTFSAHPKLVEKHITMQHCTGLYQRMRNLNTPEDIQKWIAERKRRYPTKTAVEQKEAEREEKIKRGEIIERIDVKKKPADDKKKIRERKRKAKKRRKNELELVEVENEVEEVHPSGIPMFRGTNSLVDKNLEIEEPDESAQLPEPEEAEETEIALPIECSDDEDTQIPHNQSQVSNSQSKLCETGPEVANIQPAVAANLISAMASLVADYGSDSDDEPPEETPIKRIKVDEPEIPAAPKVPEVSPTEELKPKKEEHSRKHNKTKQKPKDEPAKPSTAKPIQRKRPPMLLEKLLSRSIQHERNYIAQCLKYIVENNFFDEDPGARGEV